jgi:uncharacterized protein YqfA (UPF0365 family)
VVLAKRLLWPVWGEGIVSSIGSANDSQSRNSKSEYDFQEVLAAGLDAGNCL